jgi:hypothetical protein
VIAVQERERVGMADIGEGGRARGQDFLRNAVEGRLRVDGISRLAADD